MCGVFGFITKEKHKGSSDRRKFIENALIAGTVRGDDGAGLFLVRDNQAIDQPADWVRAASDGYQLTLTKEYQDRMNYNSFNNSMYRSVIGHNRAATTGVISIDNAHPFQEGPVTLVHNGTLITTSTLAKPMWELKKEQEIEVDSHAICYNLAHATDPADVISKLDGAFVLIWHDARNNSVNVVRNDKRPLFFATAKCEDTVLFASEVEMLWWLAKRCNFTVEAMVFPKPGHLLTFMPDSIVPETREVPLYVPHWKDGSHHGYYGWQGAGTNTTVHSQIIPWTPKKPKVPEPAELMLMDLNVTSDDKLKFRPLEISPVYGRYTAVIKGLVVTPTGDQLPCRIHGLSYYGIKDAMTKGEMWTVAPVISGVAADGCPVLTARLLHRTWTPPTLGTSTTTTDAGTSRISKVPRLGARTEHEYLPGPHEEWINVWDWLAATSDGCVQCGQVINADDADDILWVQGKARPMCVDCNVAMMRLLN